jgi:hypothetical protein
VLSWQAGPGPIAQNVLHYSYSGTAPSATDLAGAATHLNSLIQTNFIPLLWTGNTYLGCQLTDLASNTGAQVTAPVTLAGTLGGQTLAAQVAVLFNYHIATKYRGGKPRSYMPLGQGGSLANDDTWTTAFQSSCTSAIGALIAGMTPYTSGGLTITNQVAVGYYKGYAAPVTHPSGRVTQGLALNPSGPQKYVIISGTCNPKPGSQRKRLGR